MHYIIFFAGSRYKISLFETGGGRRVSFNFARSCDGQKSIREKGAREKSNGKYRLPMAPVQAIALMLSRRGYWFFAHLRIIALKDTP